jgi:hypothetical protein
MLRLRSKSALVLFGAALVATSMLGSQSFAAGGGNASEIPLVTRGSHAASAQALFRTSVNAGHTTNECKGGYRYIDRNPNPENDSNREYSVPVACN